VALAATIVLFAAAFVAMTTVRGPAAEPALPYAAPATIVVLRPTRPPPDQPPPRPRVVPQDPLAPTVALPVVLPNPRSGDPPSQPRVESPDTSRVDPRPPRTTGIPLIPTVPLHDYRPFSRDSAKRAGAGGRGPAGVTAHAGNISAAQRDSLMGAVMMEVPKLAASRKATLDETDALRRQREPGLDPRGRAARLPGQPVYAPTMGGNAQVAIAGMSIALPDGRNRARDAAVHAENMARLRRLQDFALWRRDSIRADSLRRDSIARSASGAARP
jgi:hypothetical protein